MQKLIVIVGPTASGKSALAVSLARKFNGEVISADSRQIYRGLDVGSGKIPGRWQNLPFYPLKRIKGTKRIFVYKGIPHHCIDFVSLRRVFTAAQFVSRARRAIGEIARRGHIPIIAGGTAFWIDALVFNFSLPAVKPNARLRRALEKKSAAELFTILQKLDLRRAAEIEQKNPRRLIRAIEIARTIGTTPPLRRRASYNALWIGINPAQDALTRRIKRRVNAMIKQGLVAETKKLLRQGMSEKRIREFGFEYAAALDAARGRISRAELERRVIRGTQKYARRQNAWWAKNKEIRWIRDPADARAKRAVKNFL